MREEFIESMILSVGWLITIFALHTILFSVSCGRFVLMELLTLEIISVYLTSWLVLFLLIFAIGGYS